MYVHFGEWRKISVRFVNAKNDIIETEQVNRQSWKRICFCETPVFFLCLNIQFEGSSREGPVCCWFYSSCYNMYKEFINMAPRQVVFKGTVHSIVSEPSNLRSYMSDSQRYLIYFLYLFFQVYTLSLVHTHTA